MDVPLQQARENSFYPGVEEWRRVQSNELQQCTLAAAASDHLS